MTKVNPKTQFSLQFKSTRLSGRHLMGCFTALRNNHMLLKLLLPLVIKVRRHSSIIISIN